jgi:protein phosphatase
VTRIEIPDPSVVVLVGAAGAGKSTLAARHFAPEEILSSDAFRAIIAGDEADQRVTGAAFRALGRALERRLAEEQLTVVDATSLKRADRRPVLAAAGRHGIAAVAIVLALPAAVVHARNRGRGRVVDADVIDRHLGLMADPAGLADRLLIEGFDAVVVLRDPDEVDALRIERSRWPFERATPPAPPSRSR